jgi:hypothetical protein
MAVMMQAADQIEFKDGSSHRRSTFYVPLSTEDLTCDDDHKTCEKKAQSSQNLSGFSCEWSLDSSKLLESQEIQLSSEENNRFKRYGIVLNGSVNIDDSNIEVHPNHNRTGPRNLASSTPIKDMSKSKQSNVIDSPAVMKPSIAKEKSKTLPVKDMQIAATFPSKSSFILNSTPKISSINNRSSQSNTSTVIEQERKAFASPKKSLSFIRRTNSTKLSRNNSLLKSLTSKCVENSNESISANVYDLSTDRLTLYLKAENCDDLVKDFFFRDSFNSSFTESFVKNHKEYEEDDGGLSGKP